MKRFLVALSVPILVVAVLNWRTLIQLTVGYFRKPLTQEEQTAKIKDSQINNSLRIPTLGLETPIVISKTDPTEVVDWNIIKRDLTAGVSLAEKLAKPGEPGSTIITGHSSDWTPHQYSAVFARLNDLKSGDQISVVYQDKQYIYRVSEKKVVSPSDTQFFKEELRALRSSNQLVLVTCWPLLTTEKRLVVLANPV